MSLNYDLSNIENYKDLCFMDDSLNPVTQTLIFSLMGIGMNRISEKNYKEVYWRIAFEQKIIGALMVQWENEKGSPLYVTLADVKSHIGLVTNVSPITRLQFIKRFQRENFPDDMNPVKED